MQKFVTVFAKPAGAELVDDYVIDIPQNTWIEQPLGFRFNLCSTSLENNFLYKKCG